MKLNRLWLIAFSLLVTLAACNKDDDDNDDDDDPNPDLAQEVAGNYELTYLENANGSTELPGNGVSGTITLEKTDETTVNGEIAIDNNGQVETAPFSEITLRENDDIIELYDGNTQVGTYENNKLEINIADEDEDGNPVTLILRGEK